VSISSASCFSRFELEGGRLVLRNTPVPHPEDVLARERYRSRALDLLTLLYDELRSPSKRSRKDMQERLTAAILEEFRRTAVQMGATPVFAYLPVEAEIAPPGPSLTREEDFFARYGRDRQVLALDLRPYFLSQSGNRVHFKTSGHWGPLEHRTAAEGIKTYLLERKLVPQLTTDVAPRSGRAGAHLQARPASPRGHASLSQGRDR